MNSRAIRAIAASRLIKNTRFVRKFLELIMINISLNENKNKAKKI